MSRLRAHPPQHWSWCRQTLPCPANVLVFALSNHWWVSHSWIPCKGGGPRGWALPDFTLVAKRSPSYFSTRVLAPSMLLSSADCHFNILMLQHGIHHQSWQKWASKHMKCELSSQLTIIAGWDLPWDLYESSGQGGTTAHLHALKVWSWFWWSQLDWRTHCKEGIKTH